MTGDEPWYLKAGIQDILITAPPGCGKTHHLAHLIHSLIARGLVERPQQILALTFSVKAKKNLETRIHQLTSPTERRRVHVTNFHGISYRLYRAHAATLDLDPEALLPMPGWLAEHRQKVAKRHGSNPYWLSDLIEEAKAGAFDQDETLSRLRRIAGEAGVAYEKGLRQANRLDYPDAIRHALRLLDIAEIRHLYQWRFPIVVVDECQDLTRHQFRIAEQLSRIALVLAGDQAQGIYGFAGAEPTWVYERILERDPLQITLDKSYRSSPAVLRVVSAVAQELGGTALECADPTAWPDDCTTTTLTFQNTRSESAEVLARIQTDLAANHRATIGVMARSQWRRQWIEAAARHADIPFELWDHPVHRPRVVQLLRKHLPTALRLHDNDNDRVEELYLLCLEDCGQDALDTQDELIEAFETIKDLINSQPLEQVIGDIRTEPNDAVAIAPGLHFLTGHSGKGQQFDHVYVIGLEDDVLPDYRANTPEKLHEELAVLHVMVSRARHSLTITATTDVRRDPNRPWNRRRSRWLPLLKAACTT